MTTFPLEHVYQNEPAEHRFVFRPKDPISALTHFIGFLLAIIATPILLVHASRNGDSAATMIGLSVFMLSMIQLYGASASYHSFDVNPRINKVLKKIDHMSIFLLIAGSYTPICITAIGGTTGRNMLIAIWAIAFVGCVFKYFWVTCPRWVSSVIYISMGWAVIAVLPQTISALSAGGFGWLLAGGIIYTVGGIIYALKLPIIPKNNIGFGNHELFHLFVMAGTLCHFIVMFQYIAMIG
ncbi:MAG: hemolysin III family protein [Solobacterium sp.]|jgi:hemolysin III|nr:hemolysin III family protein [Solobacterium sp.]MCH4266739.1 hemolysin III family protein [Solobacterium sp.]